MTETKNEYKAKAEVALMGMVIEPTDNEEALKICDYIVEVVKNTITDFSDEYKAKLKDVVKNHSIIGISASRIDDMVMINLPLDEPLNEEETSFGYVLNLTVPYFSEYGYCAYRKRFNKWFRVS